MKFGILSLAQEDSTLSYSKEQDGRNKIERRNKNGHFQFVFRFTCDIEARSLEYNNDRLSLYDCNGDFNHFIQNLSENHGIYNFILF